MKELFGIFLSDDNDVVDTYDLYINSSDKNLAQTAIQLKTIEEDQESKRLALFESKIVKRKILQKNDIKKNIKTETNINVSKTSRSSHKKKTGDDHIKDKQPEK